MTTWPRSDWRTRRSSPAPWHSAQTIGSVPGAVPRPAQAAQVAGRRTEISLRHPKTASANSRPIRTSASDPGAGPAPAATARLAEEGLEDVAQSALEAEAPGAAALGAEDALGAEAVIAGPLLRVAQHLVGQRHLFELRLGHVVPGLLSGCSSRARAR